MAKLGQSFNAEEYDTEQREYENLPDGIYVLEVEESEVRENDNGSRLVVTCNVLAPDHFAGRKYFDGYTLENRNPQAQEIGQRQLASLCRAVGIGEIDDSDALHNQAFTVKMGMGKPSKDGQYPARNQIKRYYFPDDGNVPEPEVTETARPLGANDNKPARGANQTQAQPKRRPWGNK